MTATPLVAAQYLHGDLVLTPVAGALTIDPWLGAALVDLYAGVRSIADDLTTADDSRAQLDALADAVDNRIAALASGGPVSRGSGELIGHLVAPAGGPVPLTRNGQVIGTATVHPDGTLAAVVADPDTIDAIRGQLNDYGLKFGPDHGFGGMTTDDQHHGDGR